MDEITVPAYSIVAFLISASSLTLGFIVLLANHRSPTYISWFLLSIAISLAGLGWGFRELSTSEDMAIFWGGKVLYTSIIFVPLFFFRFVINFLGKHQTYTNTISVMYITALALWGITIFTKLVIEGMSPRFSFKYFTDPGPLVALVFIYFATVMFFSHKLLFDAYKKSSGYQKNQLRYFFVGSFVAFLGGLSTFIAPLLKNIQSPILSYTHGLIILFSVLSSFTILKYRLLDFNLVARWGLAYGIFATFISSVFILIFSFLQKIGTMIGIEAGMVLIFSASIIVLIFEPAKKKISGFVDTFIFKAPDFQLILSDINNLLSKKRGDLENLAKNISDKLKKLLNTEHALLVLWNFDTSDFVPIPKENLKKSPLIEGTQKITRTDFLVKTLETEKRLFKYGVIFEEELINLIKVCSSAGEKATFKKIRRTMLWLGAAACAPLFTNEELVGFIVLGPKKNKALYNKEDQKFLAHLSEIVSQALKSHYTSPDSLSVPLPDKR